MAGAGRFELDGIWVWSVCVATGAERWFARGVARWAAPPGIGAGER